MPVTKPDINVKNWVLNHFHLNSSLKNLKLKSYMEFMYLYYTKYLLEKKIGIKIYESLLETKKLGIKICKKNWSFNIYT